MNQVFLKMGPKMCFPTFIGESDRRKVCNQGVHMFDQRSLDFAPFISRITKFYHRFITVSDLTKLTKAFTPDELKGT